MKSEVTTVKCWRCRYENIIYYGGQSDSGSIRCEICNAVIAEAGVDTLTIPETESQATSIKERHGDFTLVERIKRIIGWR